MKEASNVVAGTLIFLGSAQFILFMIVAEALYPGYNISFNYISDLGVGPSASIFNSSVFLLGLTAISSVYYLRKFIPDKKIFLAFMFLCGIGAMGVGIFSEHFGFIHTIVSLIAFIFGGLSATYSSKISRKPFSYFSLILGLISIISLVIFVVFEMLEFFRIPSYLSFNYLGLGRGGMERMVVYPVLVWALGFGGYLIGQK
ncbi:MAG: DUF998 domain-containing protein [Nitrososphaeria archaeon]